MALRIAAFAFAVAALLSLALASIDRASLASRPRRAIHGAAASGEYYTAYGICAPYPLYSSRAQQMADLGFSSGMAACDPYVTDHKDMVFYYTSIWPEGDNLTHSYIDLLGGVQNLVSYMTAIPATCREVLMPFICQQAFSPCIYLSPALTNVTEGIAVRNATCRSTCDSVFSTCSTFLNNPFVISYMNGQPSLKYYRPCNATDDLIDSALDTYPVGNFSFWYQSIPCNPNLPPFIWPSPIVPPTPGSQSTTPTSATNNAGTPTSNTPGASTVSPTSIASSATTGAPTTTVTGGAEQLHLTALFSLSALIAVLSF